LFGYIKPFSPDLRVRELEGYRAVYCGLCRALKKEYGLLASLLVSYDMTFAAMVLTEGRENCRFASCRCVASPFRKKTCAVINDALKVAAAETVLTALRKAEDDLRDESFFKRLGVRLYRPFLKHWAKKAEKKYPELAFETGRALSLYETLEKENCESVDRMLDAAGMSGEALASYAKSERHARAAILYDAARFMTIADALDDFREDEKKGRFNLLRARAGSYEEAKEYSLRYLAFLSAGAEEKLEKLSFDPYQPILRNVFLLGMRMSLEETETPHRKRRKRGYPHGERSL